VKDVPGARGATGIQPIPQRLAGGDHDEAETPHATIAGALQGFPREIVKRQPGHFEKADPGCPEGIRAPLKGVVAVDRPWAANPLRFGGNFKAIIHDLFYPVYPKTPGDLTDVKNSRPGEDNSRV
jgi:hypothetical protein